MPPRRQSPRTRKEPVAARISLTNPEKNKKLFEERAKAAEEEKRKQEEATKKQAAIKEAPKKSPMPASNIKLERPSLFPAPPESVQKELKELQKEKESVKAAESQMEVEEEEDDEEEEVITFCAICNIECHDENKYFNHTSGMGHMMKASAMGQVEKTEEDTNPDHKPSTGDKKVPVLSREEKEKKEEEDAQNKIYTCDYCHVRSSSFPAYQAHCDGKKHLHRQHCAKMGGPLLAFSDGIESAPIDDPPICQKYLDECEKPLVGLRYIVEIRRSHPSKPPYYGCTLCAEVMVEYVAHTYGNKGHRKMFLKAHLKEKAEELAYIFPQDDKGGVSPWFQKHYLRVWDDKVTGKADLQTPDNYKATAESKLVEKICTAWEAKYGREQIQVVQEMIGYKPKKWRTPGKIYMRPPTPSGKDPSQPDDIKSMDKWQAKRIYVGNIPDGLTQGALSKFFTDQMMDLGLWDENENIAKVEIYPEKKFAFLTFQLFKSASNCLELDGISYQGSYLRLRRPNEYKPFKGQPEYKDPKDPKPNKEQQKQGGQPDRYRDQPMSMGRGKRSYEDNFGGQSGQDEKMCRWDAGYDNDDPAQYRQPGNQAAYNMQGMNTGRGGRGRPVQGQGRGMRPGGGGDGYGMGNYGQGFLDDPYDNYNNDSYNYASQHSTGKNFYGGVDNRYGGGVEDWSAGKPNKSAQPAAATPAAKNSMAFCLNKALVIIKQNALITDADRRIADQTLNVISQSIENYRGGQRGGTTPQIKLPTKSVLTDGLRFLIKLLDKNLLSNDNDCSLAQQVYDLLNKRMSGGGSNPPPPPSNPPPPPSQPPPPPQQTSATVMIESLLAAYNSMQLHTIQSEAEVRMANQVLNIVTQSLGRYKDGQRGYDLPKIRTPNPHKSAMLDWLRFLVKILDKGTLNTEEESLLGQQIYDQLSKTIETFESTQKGSYGMVAPVQRQPAPTAGSTLNFASGYTAPPAMPGYTNTQNTQYTAQTQAATYAGYGAYGAAAYAGNYATAGQQGYYPGYY